MKNRQQTPDLLYSCSELDVCTLNGKILQFGFFYHSYCNRMVDVLLLFTAFKMGVLTIQIDELYKTFNLKRCFEELNEFQFFHPIQKTTCLNALALHICIR